MMTHTCQGCGAPVSGRQCSYCLVVAGTSTDGKPRYDFGWSDPRVLFDRPQSPFNWVVIGNNDAQTQAP